MNIYNSLITLFRPTSSNLDKKNTNHDQHTLQFLYFDPEVYNNVCMYGLRLV